MSKMLAMGFKEFGKNIELLEVNQPEPKPYEVLIQVAYAGVNPVDVKVGQGLLKDRIPHHFPVIPGWDVSGQVVAVGSRVTHLKKGDPVMAYCRKPSVQWGTYAEYVAFIADHVVKKPSFLSYAQAAAIPLTALTAWQAIFDSAHVRKDQKVLIQAGAGGVGSFAIQLAKQAGALVATTARTHNHPYVKQLGADLAIDYSQNDPVEAVKKWAPEGVDIVFEMIGGKVMEQSIQSLKPGGFLVTILEQVKPEAAAEADIFYEYKFVRSDPDQLSTILQLIENKKVQVPPIKIFELKEAPKAHHELNQGHTQGKIVLKVAGDL